MKRILTIITLMVLTLTISAQPPHDKKFNPEKFQRDQESFITKEAKLTPQEAAAFFPIFREQQQKQRELFDKQRELVRKNPQNNKEAERLISNMDELDLKIKKLQQQYHSKFCKAIPATKVHLCIKAEEHFKHKVMENIAKRMNDNRKHRDGKKK